MLPAVRVLIVLLFCGAHAVMAQNNELADIVKKFNGYSRDNLREKIFIHTDKETYLSNEVIWIKAYCVSEMLHMPMALSKVVYAELVNTSNESVLQAKIEMSNGLGNGSIDVSSLPTGTYRLRSYTRWMMNGEQNYFFEKNIVIINAQLVAPERNTQAQTIYAEFFPEGGSLVAGLTSTVGFKLTDNFGSSIDATGVILDQNNATVASFQPERVGLGKFQFTPQQGSQYKAVITYQGVATTHKLPDVASQGYVMDVKGSDKLSITITRNNPAIETEYVLLLAHTRQQVKSVLVAFFKDNKAVFTVDKNKLGDGVSHLTVFDRLKNPICERLVFKKPVNQLVIESKPQLYQYSTREQVNVNLLTRDSKAAPVSANLSFSIYAVDSLQQTPQPMGILSYMYLVSDLGDKIEQPDLYFTDSIAQKSIDNVMLTHGWRKFDWKKIMSNETPPLKYAPEYEGQIITGIARDEATGMLADSAKIYLTVAGKNPLFQSVKTDRKGNFEFAVTGLHGVSPVIFQASGGYNVQLRSQFDSRMSSASLKDFSLVKETEQTLTTSNIHTQVERAFQVTEKQRPVTFDTTQFYGKPTIAYNLDDYVRFPTLEDVFREYVPGVIVRKSGEKRSIYIVNMATQTFFTQEPLILLDGMPVLNTNTLLSTDANAIEKISLVNQRYYLGNVAYSGILDVRTFKGNLGSFDIDPKAVVIDYEGLQRQRQFHSPEYATPDKKADRLPDFRNVLHWQPNIDTDKSGNQIISFYTSDKKGNFVGVIHGMTANGLMGSKTFTILVK